VDLEKAFDKLPRGDKIGNKTKVMISGDWGSLKVTQKAVRWPCGVC